MLVLTGDNITGAKSDAGSDAVSTTSAVGAALDDRAMMLMAALHAGLGQLGAEMVAALAVVLVAAPVVGRRAVQYRYLQRCRVLRTQQVFRLQVLSQT